MSDLVQRPHSPHWARAEPVQGETLAEWRANAKQGALYRLGDIVLVWVNEGDLYSPNTEALVDTFGQQLHGALSGVATVVACAVKEKDAEIERLTAERDALKADAARYRWLRDPDKCYWLEVRRQPDGEPIFRGDGAGLDAAIDAQIAKEASNG